MIPAPPTHTTRLQSLNPADFAEDDRILVAGAATESRGRLPIWTTLYKADPARITFIEPLADGESISINNNGGGSEVLLLRDELALARMVSVDKLLLDVSGLPHHVWAPILRAAHTNTGQLRILYAEPQSYKMHPSPASATMFDLSVEFGGLKPLPGFARLSTPDDSQTIFVAMLGFEGNRPERLVLQLDPMPKIIPVVGIPGFQIHFPTYTIACNRTLISEYGADAEIRFARASCPFEAYHALREVRRDYPDHFMYLAPVGTKPHSLAVVWYSINNPDFTEIMFDHPIRKSGRTKGIGIVHIYDFSDL